jgi:quercetin dioxygenase-like cupin family protein
MFQRELGDGQAGRSVKLVTAQVLPAMKGDKLKATVLEVSYPPGGSSSAHRHPCPVIGYILEGRYRTQVEGSPATIYQKGDTFYEPANGVHQVSANASTTEAGALSGLLPL